MDKWKEKSAFSKGLWVLGLWRHKRQTSHHSVFTISVESQHGDVEACSRDKVTTLSAWYSNHLKSSPLNKSSALTTGIQIVSIVTMIKGCETWKHTRYNKLDGPSDWKWFWEILRNDLKFGFCFLILLPLILCLVGGSEFEGLKGGFRMMSLLTLFGGLKNVFKVKKYTTDTLIFRLHYKVTLGTRLYFLFKITFSCESHSRNLKHGLWWSMGQRRLFYVPTFKTIQLCKFELCIRYDIWPTDIL